MCTLLATKREQKNPHPTQGRGTVSSRYHPVLPAPHDADLGVLPSRRSPGSTMTLHQSAAQLRRLPFPGCSWPAQISAVWLTKPSKAASCPGCSSLATLQLVTEPPGTVYSPAQGGPSTCNSEGIFNAAAAPASQRRRLSVAAYDVYSSSSTLFSIRLTARRLVSTLVPARYAGQEKTPFCEKGSLASLPGSPHLAEQCSAGIGTLPAALLAGCRASQGRLPPPVLMRALTASVQLFGYIIVVS
jgi:hypothetical protein